MNSHSSINQQGIYVASTHLHLEQLSLALQMHLYIEHKDSRIEQASEEGATRLFTLAMNSSG